MFPCKVNQPRLDAVRLATIMSFANFDLEAQRASPQKSSAFPSKLGSSLAKLSDQIQEFGLLVQTFNSQRQRLGSRGDSQQLRDRTDKLQKEIAELGNAISDSLAQAEQAPGADQPRELFQINHLGDQFQHLRAQFTEAEQQYVTRKNAVKFVDEKTPLVERTSPQQGLLQQQTQVGVDEAELQFHTLMTQEREQEIQRVAHGVQEVNAIFKDLNTLVTQQGEQIDAVEDNITQVAGNTADASRELKTAHELQKRRTKCSLVMLVALVVIILVILLAAQ